MSKSDQGMSVPISLRIKSRVLTSVICFSCLLAPSLTVSHQSSPAHSASVTISRTHQLHSQIRPFGICRFQCLEHSFPDTCIDDLSPFTFLVNSLLLLRPSLTTSYKIVSPFLYTTPDIYLNMHVQYMQVFIVHLPPLRGKLPESMDFCSFYCWTGKA